MYLSEESEADRKIPESRASVVKSSDVVGYFADIRLIRLRCSCDFEEKKITDRRLSTLDPAGKNRLAADKGPNQQVRVRQVVTDSSEFADGALSLCKGAGK